MKKARQDNGIDLGLRTVQEYMEVPLRRPAWVIVPLLLTFAASIAAAYLMPKKYRSSTLILVESEKVPDTFVARIATVPMGRRLQTIQQEILSRTRLERVLQELDPYPASGAQPVPVSRLVERMRRSTTLQTRGDDAFTVEYIHTDPAKAKAVANRLASLFIEQAEGAREKQAVEGYEFIDSQLEEMRAELAQKEEAVRRLKQRYLGSLPEQLDSNLSALGRLQLEEQTLEESLSAARTRADLRRQSATQQRTGPAGEPAAGSLAALREELASLRLRYTDQHPDVRNLLRRIQLAERSDVPSAAAAPVPSAAGGVADVEREIESLLAKRERLTQDRARIQARVDAAPRVEQELTTLTRDYAQLQESYVALLRKQMDAKMAREMERRWKGERFTILDPAPLPDRPYSPNRTLFALAGLIGGLVFGLGCAFAAEFFDHSIKSAEQLEELLKQPILATIPDLTTGAVARSRAR